MIDDRVVYVWRYNPYGSLDATALDQHEAALRERQQRALALPASAFEPLTPSRSTTTTTGNTTTNTSSTSNSRSSRSAVSSTSSQQQQQQEPPRTIRSDIVYCDPYNPYGSLGDRNVSDYWKSMCVCVCSCTFDRGSPILNQRAILVMMLLLIVPQIDTRPRHSITGIVSIVRRPTPSSKAHIIKLPSITLVRSIHTRSCTDPSHIRTQIATISIASSPSSNKAPYASTRLQSPRTRTHSKRHDSLCIVGVCAGLGA